MTVRHFLLPLAAMAMSAQIAPPVRDGAAIVVATSGQLAPVLRSLAAAFARDHKGRPIRIEPVGSDVAMAYLSTGRADVAVLGRAVFDQEAKAYEWVFRRPPTATPLFLGSIATPGQSPALAFRVHAANPLKAVSLDQIRAAFRREGAAPRWSDIGVSGALAVRPIRLVIPGTESGTGRFVRKQALGDQVQFHWAQVREVGESRPGLTRDSFGARIAASVAKDVTALGVGDAAPLSGTRVLGVIVDGKAKWPGERGYPFERSVQAYTDHEIRPEAAAFLRFVRSAAARPMLIKSGYRPS